MLFQQGIKILTLVSLILAGQLSFAEDKVLSLVKSLTNSVSTKEMQTWNPGFAPFDESQLRLDVDDKGNSSEISFRLSLKPLSGIGNELRITEKRQEILNLEIKNTEQQSRLGAYTKVLDIWRVNQAVLLTKASSGLFQKARSNLESIKKINRTSFDLTKYIINISNFEEINERYNSFERELTKSLKINPKQKTELQNSLKSLSFLDYSLIKKALESTNAKEEMTRVNKEKSVLNQYEFEKKKREAFQLLKFVSVNQEAHRNRPDEYSFQLAFRIPFLSDNQELHEAKVDYIMEKTKIEVDQIQREKELSQLKSEILSLIAKASLLKHLPSKSLNSEKAANSLFSVSEAIDGEIDFLKGKIDFLNTHALIFERYLFYLSLNDRLGQTNTNYLTHLP